jgi:DNA-directed RNA polymerase subunit RPC12/RpoP
MAGELTPGATPRRWIPEGGIKKHNEKIHRESKVSDNKNLPFQFSKPPKNKRHEWFECVECGRVISAPVNTIMYACPDCKKATKVERIKE